jgi:hypothetical protein
MSSFDQIALSNVFQSAPKLSVPLAPSVQSAAQTPIITLRVSTNPPVILRVPFAHSPAPLAAGIYKTEPYTCLVLVPGPHLDDKFVISGNGGPQIQMPTVQPGLKFIPLKPFPH